MGPNIASELERLRDFVEVLDRQIVECQEAIDMNPHSVNPESHVTACRAWANKCEARATAQKIISSMALR